MAASHQTRAEEQREKADEYEAVLEALEELRDEVLEADQIGETRLSKLFHEARTSRKSSWKKATAFVDVEDGEAVVDSVAKIREGRWAPETTKPHDAVVSVGIRPFMETDVFKSMIRDRLERDIRGARTNAADAERSAEMHERRAEQDR